MLLQQELPLVSFTNRYYCHDRTTLIIAMNICIGGIFSSLLAVVVVPMQQSHDGCELMLA